MSDRRRHQVVLACGLGLLGFVIWAPARWHLAAGALGFALVWALAPALRRGIGPPRRWLVALAALALLGAWLGASDGKLLGRSISFSGALAATTMVARALGLVAMSTSAMALYPPARAVGRLAGTRYERVGEVLLIALALVPSLIVELRGARSRLAEDSPGWAKLPRRLFATIVFAIEHAAHLAERIARDLAASTCQKESSG